MSGRRITRYDPFSRASRRVAPGSAFAEGCGPDFAESPDERSPNHPSRPVLPRESAGRSRERVRRWVHSGLRRITRREVAESLLRLLRIIRRGFTDPTSAPSARSPSSGTTGASASPVSRKSAVCRGSTPSDRPAERLPALSADRRRARTSAAAVPGRFRVGSASAETGWRRRSSTCRSTFGKRWKAGSSPERVCRQTGAPAFSRRAGRHSKRPRQRRSRPNPGSATAPFPERLRRRERAVDALPGQEGG